MPTCCGATAYPLPQFMEGFIRDRYSKHRTQTEARRYILEATLFTPTLSLLTRENARGLGKS